MKYSLRYPKVTFDDFIYDANYENLKKEFFKQANSFDNEDENSIWINEFDTDNRNESLFFDDGPPEEIKKNLYLNFLLPLVRKAELKMVNEIYSDMYEKGVFSSTAILVLRRRYTDIINQLNISIDRATHLHLSIADELKTCADRLEQYINEEFSINFTKDYSKNKIKLKLDLKEVCWLFQYLSYKGLIGSSGEGSDRQNIVNIIESHFLYYSEKDKKFVEITTAKNTISRNIKDKAHRSFPDKLENVLEGFRAVFDKLVDK